MGKNLKASELKSAHSLIRGQITKRLADFRKVGTGCEKRIFEELCFCLLTAGANAENCKRIIDNLKSRKLLFCGAKAELKPFLRYARFYNQKADRILSARRRFLKNGRFSIKKSVFCGDPVKVREWLVENVDGLGFKEASHFLRNIGIGENLAILDRHILKNLKNYGAIEELPKTLTPKRYLEIENKMCEFSKRHGIPISHLDILFFSKATGKPVKFCK